MKLVSFTERGCRQILVPIWSEFKLINQLYSTWNHQNSVSFLTISGEIEIQLIRLNLFNIRKEIWQRKLLVRGWVTNFSPQFVPFSQIGCIRKDMMAFELQLVRRNSTCALSIFFLILSDSKPNSWYSFSWEVTLIAPAMARDALYWTLSILLLTDSFSAWSYITSP